MKYIVQQVHNDGSYSFVSEYDSRTIAVMLVDLLRAAEGAEFRIVDAKTLEDEVRT